MPWSSLANNQMVSYLDAQTSGFVIREGQTNPGTNQCMTKDNAFAMYYLTATASTNALASNQLIQKSLWLVYTNLGGYWNDPCGDEFTNFYVGSNGLYYTYNIITGNYDLFTNTLYKPIGPSSSGYFWNQLTYTNGAVTASTTIDSPCTPDPSNTFIAQYQTYRSWAGMTTTSNGDVYACVYDGDIYKRTGGVGNFVATGQTTRYWSSMTTDSNDVVYASVNNGDIYKLTPPSTIFTPTGQTSRYWRGMTPGPDGSVYAAVAEGDIYKKPLGNVTFAATGQTSRQWNGMTSTPNGDVYASANDATGYGIYKQTGGTGSFVQTNSINERYVYGMTSLADGTVYACVRNGDIYKQVAGASLFFGTGQINRFWHSMTTTPDQKLYASVWAGDIYKEETVTVSSVTFSSWSSQSYTTGSQSTSGTVTIVGNPATFFARATVIASGTTCTTNININGNTRSAYRPTPGTTDSTTFTLNAGTYSYSVSLTNSTGGLAIAGGIYWTQ